MKDRTGLFIVLAFAFFILGVLTAGTMLMQIRLNDLTQLLGSYK